MRGLREGKVRIRGEKTVAAAERWELISEKWFGVVLLFFSVPDITVL